MTTKKELRTALERLLNSYEDLRCGRRVSKAPAEDARAVLARPAVVVGYAVPGHITLYPDDHVSLEQCRDYCRDIVKRHGGTVRKLVVR